MGNFFTSLILILSIFGLVLFIMNKFLRKWLNGEKKEFFSNHFVNKKHKKMDWTIRITFIVVMLVGFFFNVSEDPSKHIWFLQPYILLFGLIFVTELVDCYGEKICCKQKWLYFYICTISSHLAIFNRIVFDRFFWLAGMGVNTYSFSLKAY